MEGLDYWRLCDEVSVVEAALLIVGEEPTADNIYQAHRQGRGPQGFEAARNALVNALRSGTLRGHIKRETTQAIDESEPNEIADSVCVYNSRVEVNSVRSWLKNKGFTTGFFFPEPVPSQEYLDPFHPRYAPKLAAAVTAWVSVGEARLNRGTPKQALAKWLRENAASYGLTDDEGKPTETAIEDIAKVANWQTSGGAPKTPTSEATLD